MRGRWDARGLRGVAVGGLASMGIETGVALYDGEALSCEDVTVAGVSGVGGGAVGGAVDTAVAAQLTKAAIAQNITSHAGRAALRGLGGGLGGGPVAAGIEMGRMGWRDWREPGYDPTGVDYGARGTRAFVVGGLSAGATAAGVALVFGAAAVGRAPIVAGVLVGIALCMAVDYLIGDAVERGARRALQ